MSVAGGGLPSVYDPSTDEAHTVLVVTAHPDDVDFGAAGTVAVLTKAGIAVTYCIATNGEAGGSDRTVPRDEMAAIRQREQRDAASEVGVSDVRFLGYPDGRVTSTFDLRRDISRVIREVRPDRVVTQSPDRNWERLAASHPDHMAVGEAAVCAVYPDARNPFAHPELLDDGLEPHTVPEIWLMGPGGTTLVDITDTIDRKIAALLSHRSQIADPDGLREMLHQFGRATASGSSLPEGSYAESFRVVAAP
jgi:LmbE family N-acetylglucosaminyl deacetylase